MAKTFTPPRIATQYDYDAIENPVAPFDPKSIPLVNQSDRDHVDLNKMFKQYEKDGTIPDSITGTMRPPQYVDFTQIPDFHTMQNTIARVTQAFNAYPAHIRSRFENDPAQLIKFLSDPKNEPEAISLGLKPAPKIVVKDKPAGSEATPPASGNPAANSLKKKSTPPPPEGEE